MKKIVGKRLLINTVIGLILIFIFSIFFGFFLNQNSKYQQQNNNLQQGLEQKVSSGIIDKDLVEKIKTTPHDKSIPVMIKGDIPKIISKLKGMGYDVPNKVNYSYINFIQLNLSPNTIYEIAGWNDIVSRISKGPEGQPIPN